MIKARPGKPVDIKIDSSLRVDEKGCVIAEIDGLLHFHHNYVKVNPVLEVEESVDFSTGNIDFMDSVLIRQGVRDRVVVKATRDIVIHRLVEAATSSVNVEWPLRTEAKTQWPAMSTLDSLVTCAARLKAMS